MSDLVQNVRQLGFKIVAETSKISKIKGKMFTLKLDIDKKKVPEIHRETTKMVFPLNRENQRIYIHSLMTIIFWNWIFPKLMFFLRDI